MNKFLTKIAALSVGLAMAIGVGVAVGSGSKESVRSVRAAASYTITFSGSASESTTISTSTTAASITGSSSYVTGNVATATKAYGATSGGVKLGTSSAAGTLKINLSTSGQVTPTSVVVNAKLYNSSKSATLGFNGSTKQSVASDYANITFNYTTALTYIQLDVTKYVWVKSVTVNYNSGSTKLTTPSPSYNDTNKEVTWSAITGASSYQVKVDSGSYATATSPYDVSGLTTGVSHTVYVIAKGDGTNYTDSDAGSTTFTPTTPKVLSSISVSGQTTTFNQGDTFAFGGTVTAHYEDSTTADVTASATFSGYDLSTSGSQTVTVSYGGKTTTYSITVNESPKFELIKSTNDLVAGSEYLIGGSGENNGYFISTTQASNNRTATTGTVSNEKVTLTSSMQVITLGGTSDAWTLYATGGDHEGYLYTATTGSNRLHTRANDSDNNSKWAITVASTGLATIHNVGNTSRGQMNYNYNSGSPIFNCYATGGDLCIYKLIDTSESIQINKDSVSGLKGDADTSVSIVANNFTPTNITVSYSEANVATVSKGTIADHTIPLSVSFDGVGTTTATITVKGGSQDYTAELGITVAAKPASMTIVHSDIVAGHLEIQNGQYKQVSFSGLDTDGNPYTIAAADVTGTVQSGSSVELSGTRITGTSTGSSVVRYTLKALTSVYAEVTVDVANDYKTTVNSITFNSNLSDTQGDAVDTSAVFATKTADTHFGDTVAIEDSELLFSYENNRSGAEAIGVFSYDFSHGTTVDPTHKSQTVYVFVTFDSSYSGNFTITIEQRNDPLTAITFTNVVNNEVDVTRGSTFQLEWAYTPTNPTDGKEVNFRIDDNDDGIGITVSAAGLISITAASDLGTALVIIESAHDATIYDYVYVSAVLESMTYTVSEEESWAVASSLTVGDRVVIAGVHSDVNYELSGVSSNIGGATSFSSDPAGTFTLTVGEGNAANSYTFSNGNSYLAYTSSATSGSNYLYTITNPTSEDQLNQASWTVSIEDGAATITNVYNTNRKILLNYNNGSPRFCAYTSSPSTTMHLPEIYKLSGGNVEKTVDETLFNGVHNNFGAGKTYEWSESCPSFDSSKWLSACNALKGIASYSSYKLNRAVANASGNEIEVFLAKYDALVTKFGETYDHLNRFGGDGINPALAPRVNLLSNLGNNANTVAIVIVISAISVTAIGGYFFLRKRKEQ